MPTLLGLLACSAPPRLIDQPLAPSALVAPAPEPQPAEVLAFPGDPELSRLLEQVSTLRGLAAPPTLRLVELPARELAAVALARAAQDWPEPARQAQEQLLWRLGLLPAASSLLALLEPALETQLEAFYSRAEGVPALYVRSELKGRARRRAVAHELVHALQDHQHGLLRRLADEALSNDRRSALHALAEADALAVVERLGLAAEEEASAASAPSLPAVLQRALAAPYLDGRARVAEALRAGGFRAVDRLLHEPPEGTNVLLHSATVAAAAAPLPEFPSPGAGWQLRHADVLGEQSLRVVLEEEGEWAAELAEHWRGDRLTVFEQAEGSALIWELELTDGEAAAGVAPLLQRGRQRSDSGTRGGTGLPATEWSCGAHSDTGVVATARRQRRVVFASLTLGAQIVNAPAQCATLREWISGARFALRPGSGEPHRSPHTPPGSRSGTVQ